MEYIKKTKLAGILALTLSQLAGNAYAKDDVKVDTELETELSADAVKKEGDLKTELPVIAEKSEIDAKGELPVGAVKRETDLETELSVDAVKKEGDLKTELPVIAEKSEVDAKTELPADTVQTESSTGEIIIEVDNSVLPVKAKTIEVIAPVYDIKFEDVLEGALKVSHEFKALFQELKSTEILQDKEKKYYYPTATLSTEMKEYYGAPQPDPNSTGEGILTLSAKLWGTGVNDRIGASDNNRLSGEMNLKNKELEIYYTVLKYLTKIELIRQFKLETDDLRRELEGYYQKQLNATKQGVSTQSDAMEVELTKSRFEEQVFSEVSNIAKYFRVLRIETGLEFASEKETESIGIDYQRIKNRLEQGITEFKSADMIVKNYDLRSREYVLQATRQSAQAQRERFKVELVNETHLVGYGGDDFEPGDTDESYIGLTLTYDLFNHGLAADQDSSVALYIAEKERYDNDIKKFSAQLDAKVEDYKNTMAKRKKLIEQLRINRKLIENQKNEIYTDKVTYLDIAESISSLNQSQISLLNMELSLYDLLYELMELKSEKIY